MSLSTARTKLLRSYRDLEMRWSRVRDTWRDPVAEEFEKAYIASIEDQVKRTVAAIEHVGAIADKARRDCS